MRYVTQETSPSVPDLQSLVEKKQEADAGFKKDAYCVSKAFVVALTKGLAAENTGLQINW